MRSSGRDLLHVPLALALGLLGAPACKDKPAVPPGPSGLPPLSAGTPEGDRSALVHAPEGGEGALPAGHPALPEGHPAMPEGHPGTLAGHTPVPQTEDQPFRPPADAGTRVRGVIKLSDKLKGKVAPGTTIFLMARPAVNGRPAPGMPLAVKRLEAGPWPLPFEITGSDVMIEGSRLQGQVVLTARADQDGDAMTKSPGDVEGASKVFQVPQEKVEVVLDTLRTEAAGAPSPPNLGH